MNSKYIQYKSLEETVLEKLERIKELRLSDKDHHNDEAELLRHDLFRETSVQEYNEDYNIISQGEL